MNSDDLNNFGGIYVGESSTARENTKSPHPFSMGKNFIRPPAVSGSDDDEISVIELPYIQRQESETK